VSVTNEAEATLFVNYGSNHNDKYKSLDEIRKVIGEIAKPTSGYIWEAETNNINIIMNFNEVYDKVRSYSGEFTEYPYYLEVTTREGANWKASFNDICELIRHLRTRGASVIPACDFEKEIEEKIGEDKVNWRLNK